MKIAVSARIGLASTQSQHAFLESEVCELMEAVSHAYMLRTDETRRNQPSLDSFGVPG
jgi:hypothetical protein